MDLATKRKLKQEQDQLKASFRFANFLPYMKPLLLDTFGSEYQNLPPDKEDRNLREWNVFLKAQNCV